MKGVISVCGKGGVGKTSVSAMLSRLIIEKKNTRGLAVDADPGGGLSLALSLPVKKTVNDLRRDVIAGTRSDKANLAASIDFQLLEALSEYKNLAFLAVGRPEEKGCYCQVNSFLREAIQVLAGQFDTVVIDAEAGIEQVNRRVMERIDYLLLVSDLSVKGIRVAETIEKVSSGMFGKYRTGLVINRAKNEEEAAGIGRATHLPVIGWIPEDETIREFDITARSFLEIHDTPALQAMRELWGRSR